MMTTGCDNVVRRAPSVRGVERRTKVVATVGPASDDPATLTAMIAAGMDMARMSLSHGTTVFGITWDGPSIGLSRFRFSR